MFYYLTFYLTIGSIWAVASGIYLSWHGRPFGLGRYLLCLLLWLYIIPAIVYDYFIYQKQVRRITDGLMDEILNGFKLTKASRYLTDGGWWNGRTRDMSDDDVLSLAEKYGWDREGS